MNNKVVSNAIDFLRFPLAVMVVAIHTNFDEGLKAVGNIDVQFSGGWAHELIHLISVTLSDCAVPMFFVISGYLYFLKTPHLSKSLWIEKTKKKALTLLVPFFCWSVVACCIEPERFLSATVSEKIFGFWSMTMKLWHGAGPWDGPLWFLRDLFVVMFCAPLIEWFCRRNRYLWVMLVYIPLLAGYDAIVPGVSIRSFLFFTMGALLAIRFPDTLQSMKLKYIWPLGLLFLCLRSFYHDRFVVEGWVLVSMALYFSIAKNVVTKIKGIDNIRNLSSASFVIYAMHRLFNAKVAALGLLFLCRDGYELTGIEAVMLYALTIVITVGVCMFANKVISRSKYLSFLLKGTR